MKKYAYAILGLLLTTTACNKKQLDLFPYNSIETTQAFNTQNDITLAVNGMYSGGKNYYVASLFDMLADVLADNVIINQSGRLSQKTFGEWRYTSTATYGLFATGYNLARRANAILENIDKFPAGAFHDDAKGQALAFRGMIYFEMSRVYAKTFLNATATDSIMPYVTTTDPTIMPQKTTVANFYNLVIADLQAAVPLIANNTTPYATGTNIRLNRVSVNGLLSRVLLYKGDYAGCIAAATACIGATPKEVTTNFAKIWTDGGTLLGNGGDSGVLFKIKNTPTDNVTTMGVNWYQPVGGLIKSEYVVEYNFYQMFAANDIRKAAYTQQSLYNGTLYNHVIKWVGRTTPTAPSPVDAKVLRSAEVLLNRAEAYARSGNDAAALTDLKILKAARYTGYVPDVLAGAPLLAEILKQRRLELAFEDDRFWDLKRQGLGVTRDGTKGEKADGSGTPYVFTTLAPNDFRMLLPYPQTELNVNHNFGNNNPGY